MPYDAVLDYDGALFRIEVKGTTTQSLDLTRGGRAGQQIDPNAASRMRPITKEDCDFVVGVRGMDNTCYIIPVEVVEILATGKIAGGHSITLSYLETYFKEKWDLFTGGVLKLSADQLRSGFRGTTSVQRQSMLTQLNISVPVPVPHQVVGTRRVLSAAAEVETLRIWEQLGE